MDAGVPIRRPVAGIAMGLMKENDKVAILSDIMGIEDALGDMDLRSPALNKELPLCKWILRFMGLPLRL